MKVCYLINQYPKISHTFIRRELQALERLGLVVSRVSIRGVDEGVVNDEDQEELEKTAFIIGSSILRSLCFLIFCLLKNAHRLPRAMRIWFKLSTAANGSYIKHCIYVMEACWLLRYCQINKIDHIHAHFGTNPAAVALFCRLLGGPSYSFTVHGPEEFDAPNQLSLKEKIHFSKFTVAITSYCKSQLYRWANFSDWQKISEVHCVVDENLLLKTTPLFEYPHRLVSIGRLCEQKGQWLLLQAIAQLVVKYPKIQLHLIGDGELKTHLQSYVEQQGLSENIIFYGWQNAESIKEQLDDAKVMLLPSFAEGLPVVIMEAFARKKPVISTYIAGIAELVDDNNGWLIPAGSISDLVEAIDSALCTSNEQLMSKGQMGFNAIVERHSADTEAKKLYQLIGGF